MSIVYKSNVEVTNKVLGKGLNVSSPQDIYADYENRVTEFGGEIINPTNCLNAIKKAVEGGYFNDTVIAISADWGVLKSDSKVVRLFSITGEGSDVVIQGRSGLETEELTTGRNSLKVTNHTSVVTPFITFQSPNSDGFYLGCVASVFTAHNTVYNLLKTSNNESTLGLGVSGNLETSSITNSSRLYTKVAGEVVAAPTIRQSGNLSKTIGLFVDTEQEALTPTGGSIIGVTTPAGAEIYNFKTTPMFFEGAKKESTGFTELWAVGDCDLSLAQKISTDQSNRHTV